MGKRAEELQSAALAVLRNRRAPMSAYDVLHALRADDRRLAPTTIYRALAALVEARSVHRVESRNAFVARQRDCGDHMAVLSVCDDCGMVEEMVSDEVCAALANTAGATGFAPSRHVIEIIGRCAACGAAGER